MKMETKESISSIVFFVTIIAIAYLVLSITPDPFYG